MSDRIALALEAAGISDPEFRTAAANLLRGLASIEVEFGPTCSGETGGGSMTESAPPGVVPASYGPALARTERASQHIRAALADMRAIASTDGDELVGIAYSAGKREKLRHETTITKQMLEMAAYWVDRVGYDEAKVRRGWRRVLKVRVTREDAMRNPAFAALFERVQEVEQ